MRKTVLSLASMAAAVLFASSVAAFLLALAEPQAAQAAGKPNIIFILTDDQFPGTDLKSKLLTFPGGRFAPHNEEERAQVAGLAHSWRSFRSRAQQRSLSPRCGRRLTPITTTEAVTFRVRLGHIGGVEVRLVG